MDDLGHHLGRGDRAQNLLAQRPLADPLDEPADHLDAHVRLEESQTDLLESGVHVVLGEVTFASERLRDPCKTFLQRLEHRARSLGHRALQVKGLGGRRGYRIGIAACTIKS